MGYVLNVYLFIRILSVEYYPLKEVIYFICLLTEYSLQLHPPSPVPIQYAILPPISWCT